MAAALDYAIEKAKEIRDAGHARGPFTWLLRRFRPGAMRPVDGVWICQHAKGNWATANCEGEPTQVWRFEGDDAVIVASLPDLDMTSATASTTPHISFCVDDAGKRMIYEEWYGGRAGMGSIMAIKKNGKWAEVERGGWVS
jgi:hypothetical protein